MTQMMLFDTSSLATSNASAATPLAGSPVVATAPSPATRVRPGSPRRSKPAAQAVSPREIRRPTPNVDGVHQMGDLARLVLLRYELIAKRRQEMAARRAK